MPRLPVDNIVNVSVNLLPVTGLDNAFNNVGLILGTSNVITAAQRMKRYSGPAEMLSDGFAATAPEYKAALLYFSQSPAPTALYVGRVNGAASPAETVVAVGKDDARICLSLTILHNLHVLILKSDHMKGANAAGTLLGSTLLRLNRIPPQTGHIVNNGFGVRHHILVGNTRIRGFLVESKGTDFLNLFLGHSIGQIVTVKRKHCIHISLNFFNFSQYSTKTVPKL